MLTLRDDGTFRNDNEPLTGYHSVVAQGKRYLAARCAGAIFGLGLKHVIQEYPALQKLLPGPAVSDAWKKRRGLTGLLVNCLADSSSMVAPLSDLMYEAPAELPGYVLGSDGVPLDASTSDEAAKMCLKLPVFFGRDLNDLEIIKRSGEEFVRIGSFVFRPPATVWALSVGGNSVAIGAEGYAEWRKLAAPGTLTTSGASAWNLYDKDFKLLKSGSGNAVTVSDPAAVYLTLWGPANGAVSVTVV